jgi:hypothetical protein
VLVLATPVVSLSAVYLLLVQRNGENDRFLTKRSGNRRRQEKRRDDVEGEPERGSSFQCWDDEERELMLIDEGRVGPGSGGSDSADAERRRLVETVGFGSGSGAADGRDARQAVRF